VEDLTRFKKIFWDAFHRPALRSPVFQHLWESLEPINNLLAGPFYAIYTNGHCDYVFQDATRFPGIDHADDLLDWCIRLVEKYRQDIESSETTNETEDKDKELLLFQTDLKMELSDLAHRITKKRW
jgi:hypothetical protein